MPPMFSITQMCRPLILIRLQRRMPSFLPLLGERAGVRADTFSIRYSWSKARLPPTPAGLPGHRTRSRDRGQFATPSLRNVELTAPYMHDGRFQTLEQVVDHYSEHVQRSATLDPNLAKHPDGGLHLSADDKLALVAFLKTLTDEKYRPGPSSSALAAQP